jgi:hypothetical protein
MRRSEPIHDRRQGLRDRDRRHQQGEWARQQPDSGQQPEGERKGRRADQGSAPPGCLRMRIGPQQFSSLRSPVRRVLVLVVALFGHRTSRRGRVIRSEVWKGGEPVDRMPATG